MKFGNLHQDLELITMSRVGKQPIEIPDKVEVKLDGKNIVVKGPKGQLNYNLPEEIGIEIKDKIIKVFPEKHTKRTPALWGLSNRLIFNMIKGVTEGYQKKLEIQGVGYRAELKGKDLVLHLGYSHPVTVSPPSGIEFKVEKNIITVEGIDKQLVGQVAADIRAKRKPDVYKGKGIRYLGEEIKLKPGKKAVTAE